MNKKMQCIILGIMCFALVIAICVQIKTVNRTDSKLSSNQAENELRSQVLKMKEKYEVAYNELQKVEDELENVRKNVTNNSSELEALEKEIRKDNMLLGLTDVKGKGVTVSFSDGKSTAGVSDSEVTVHNTDILHIVNELKNAGAEAIEVNGQRILGTTAIKCVGNLTEINGVRIGAPFVVNAIGSQELLSNISRPGSYLERMKRI